MSVLDKIKSAALTVLAMGEYFAGFADDTTISEEQQERRWAACNSCDSKSKLGLCGKCGCILEIKIPLLFNPVETKKEGKKVLTACPLNKWEQILSKP